MQFAQLPARAICLDKNFKMSRHFRQAMHRVGMGGLKIVKVLSILAANKKRRAFQLFQ